MKFILIAASGIVFILLIVVTLSSGSRSFQPPAQPDNALESTSDSTELASTSSILDDYSFDAPDITLKLDNDLREISGLTVFDENHLAAVQDEKGKIYLIDIESGEITEDDRFEDDGDYEGIEMVGGRMFVLRSDGDIFHTGNWPPKSKETEKYETFISRKYDTEGLAYDAETNSLLIACKEFPGNDLPHHRTIYAFDLDEMKLDKTPRYLIDLKQLEALAPEHPLNAVIRRLAAPITDLKGFKPSAIAIHPITRHVFVISSVRKMLLSLTPEGSTDGLWLLPEKLFNQPEGLAFLPNGDLFISNEGGNGKATLLRFNYHG